jgi:hypothetical protein
MKGIVIEPPCSLFVSREAHIRPDNGLEFMAETLRKWTIAVA